MPADALVMIATFAIAIDSAAHGRLLQVLESLCSLASGKCKHRCHAAIDAIEEIGPCRQRLGGKTVSQLLAHAQRDDAFAATQRFSGCGICRTSHSRCQNFPPAPDGEKAPIAVG